MDKHIQVFLNRISLLAVTIATIILLSILMHPPDTCIPNFTPHNPLKFPRSTCDSHHQPRPFSTHEKKNHRLWSTSAWLKKVQSFSHIFLDAQKQNPSQTFSLLSNSSRSLCVLAGAGQEVMALRQIGVSDVTAIDLVDSPPLVSRADPYNLPFFDDAFDFAFSAQFDVVMFPSRFIAEMERVIRVGGFCLLLVEQSTNEDVREIVGLFKRGKLIEADSCTFSGSKMTKIVKYQRPLDFLDMAGESSVFLSFLENRFVRFLVSARKLWLYVEFVCLILMPLLMSWFATLRELC